MKHSQVWLLAALTFTSISLAQAGAIETSVGGDNTTASIAGAIGAFRASLGAPNGVGPPTFSGRRDITWDGGGGTFGTPFNNFSTRGSVFTTPGTGFEISGVPASATFEFADINPTYPNIFRSFSSPRLFTPLGSNIMDVLFTVPGTTNVPAATAGFGAVFTDVDEANRTSMEFFAHNGVSLGTFFVPPGTVADESLSFLGVSFTEGSIIGRVRITSGEGAVGLNDGAGGVDIVVMDDFTFREPQRVPEPGILVLMAAALIGFALARKKRK